MTARVLLVWCALVASLLVLAAYCALPDPAPRTLTEAPTRAPMVTVTAATSPTVFVFPTMAPRTLTEAPREAILSTPRPTSTRVPPTATPAPTMTPTPNTTQPAVQRG